MKQREINTFITTSHIRIHKMLPVEIWLNIFEQLPFKNRVIASRVSRLFYDLCIYSTKKLNLSFNKRITDAAVSLFTGLTSLDLG